ncbi:MAG: hypothetical protein MI754_03750 [Chromatiales bacterium]|nr:hypothetical protein [Chromatiales bacterium]
MIKKILIPLALVASSATQASCLTDVPEIGDIGPGSDQVCDLLRVTFPAASTAVIDRDVRGNNTVVVKVLVDEQPKFLHYHLIGVEWRLLDLRLADNHWQ